MAPEALYAAPIRPRVFPIGQFRPGTLINNEMNQLTFIRLDVKEYSGGEVPRPTQVVLQNSRGSGTIEITAAEKNRLAGKINVNDGNLFVIGNFDCPYR